MPEFKPSAYDVISILMESGLAASKAEARRNMEQNGIKINGQITTDPKTEVKIGDVIQKGKRYFVRVM